jgi:hypothetical protein
MHSLAPKLGYLPVLLRVHSGETTAFLHGHCLPAAFPERFPFTLRFVLIGLPGAILGGYNESQT